MSRVILSTIKLYQGGQVQGRVVHAELWCVFSPLLSTPIRTVSPWGYTAALVRRLH
jgi:hypothetical protein